MTLHPLLLPFVGYAVLMSFTPGPNNLAASIFGLRQGYQKTLPYLVGVAVGFLFLLAICGFATEFIARTFGTVEGWLKWLGATYMAWLALSLFLPSKTKTHSVRGADFWSGLTFQFLNPKGILYGITLFSSFSTLLTTSVFGTLLAVGFLTLICFSAISTWTVVGGVFSRWLGQPAIWNFFRVVMVGLLAYTAYSIVT